MRLLHLGANLFRHGDAQREPRRRAQLCHRESGGSPTSLDRCGDPRADEWQYLPLRRLSQHPGGHQTSRGSANMKAFTYQRANSLTEAAATLAKPGAKLIAGGTNLLDLMKLQVETPNHLV